MHLSPPITLLITMNVLRLDNSGAAIVFSATPRGFPLALRLRMSDRVPHHPSKMAIILTAHARHLKIFVEYGVFAEREWNK
jgi:hypothetical protein